ncbi:MAG: efflux RND transporter periplasmic adaptor subunit [Mariniblastus sp.]
MKTHFKNNITGIVALIAVVVCQVSASADDRDKNSRQRISRTNQLRSSTAADEAFTESYQKILVASAENGIVSNVKVRRGDIVEVGDLLFELDQSVLEASRRLSRAKANQKAKLRSAEVQFETNTKRYEQKVKLLEEKAGSPEEVQRAKSDVEISKQNVEAILEENEQSSLETKRIESQIEQKRIRSPINGVVTDVRKKVGEYVSVNDPHVVTVEQLDALKVVFYLPTARAVKIKIGHTAEILMTEEKSHAKGTVEYVAPITKADSGRVRVEVAIANELQNYRSGVRCRLISTSSHQSAIQELLELK